MNSSSAPGVFSTNLRTGRSVGGPISRTGREVVRREGMEAGEVASRVGTTGPSLVNDYAHVVRDREQTVDREVFPRKELQPT